MHSFLQTLTHQVASKKNFLCLGIDPDPTKLPNGLDPSVDGIRSFLEPILKSVLDQVIAVKFNISFFEALGLEGLRCLEDCCGWVNGAVPIIIDGKRADIGNTATQQARYMFDYFGADATTVAPYMGRDSIQPFLDYQDKFVFVLALTSNNGASDFQRLKLADGTTLYESVLTQFTQLNVPNIGFVVGATQSELPTIRTQYPDPLFLIPGVGAQGGRYSEIAKSSQNTAGLSLINVGRSILYAGRDANYLADIQTEIQACIQP